MLMPPVSRFMSLNPVVIEPTAKIREALCIMRVNRLRHLPIAEGGKLIGIVSERDLHLLEAVAHVNPVETHVREAMTQPVFTVVPDAPLDEVAEQMVAHACGSAVVVKDDSTILGIFTTTDALIALSELLRRVAA